MWKVIAVIPLLLVALYPLSRWLLWEDKLYTLKDKRVLVTGASEGIGEQIAYQYARLGANVVVTARRLDKLNKVVENCQSLSPSPHSKHFAVSADMLNLGDTKRVIDEAVRLMGGLDVLVLNHVMYLPIRPYMGTKLDLDDINKVMDINFRSYVHLASHALPQLLKNDGSIVVVNSIAGKVPMMYVHSYSAAKHALNGFFKALREQFIAEGQNVSVTCCTLGFIDTDRGKAMRSKSRDPSLDNIPVGSTVDTALDIVIGGARRDAEVYTPYWNTRTLTFVYAIWPDVIEGIFRPVMMALAKI